MGAGIVAEKGNGEQNLNLGDKKRIAKFDFGYEGECYWVQGAAQVEMTDNIAISSNQAFDLWETSVFANPKLFFKMMLSSGK